jgi:cobalt-precorrin 5A hydrolase
VKAAVITLSPEGYRVADTLACGIEADIFLHGKVKGSFSCRRFESIETLTREIFPLYRSLVYVCPCGIAVRALAPLVSDKRTDPAVVVVDVFGRHAVSLLSGHEGGANGLAVDIANILGAEPVITTTTEAMKTIIVGIGCRKGVAARTIMEAVHAGLREARAALSEVRFLASADIKFSEQGLLDAARELGIPLRLIPSREIREALKSFSHSSTVQKKVNLPAVAEPAALLAGRRTRLLLPRIIHKGVTIALARESSLSSV